jgi:hypothetical protein
LLYGYGGYESPYKFDGDRHAKSSTADYNVPVEYTGPNASRILSIPSAGNVSISVFSP